MTPLDPLGLAAARLVAMAAINTLLDHLGVETVTISTNDLLRWAESGTTIITATIITDAKMDASTDEVAVVTFTRVKDERATPTPLGRLAPKPPKN